MTTNPESLFLLAARSKFRFPSTAGHLTAEMLWDLPLKTSRSNQASLNEVAVEINRKLKELGEESFVEHDACTTERSDYQAQLDLVKFVIATKQEEARAATERRAKESLKAQIREAIAVKKSEALSSASLEDLEAQLAALG